MNRIVLITLLAAMTVGLSSCELVADIFGAGFWTGVIVVIGIIILMIYLISKARGRGKEGS